MLLHGLLGNYDDNPWAHAELVAIQYDLRRGRIPWPFQGWLGMEEPYAGLDWSDPRDYPILSRWKQAQDLKIAVELNRRDYITPLYDKRGDSRTEDLIRAAETHNRNLERESKRLIEEAALLYQMHQKLREPPCEDGVTH